jgi:uncharacterized protein YjbI with pentapeptide repeats
MRHLLLDKDLLASEEESSLRAVARAQTLSSLLQMSPEGKGIALRFLYESHLIRKGDLIIDLENADLSGADLHRDTLIEADLSDTDLSNANLSDADLFKADLTGAKLSDANLAYATLLEADLRGADLSSADLSHANLSDTNLNEADLRGAKLSNTTLLEADLSGAKGVTKRQLEEESVKLENTIMPDGSKHD